MDIRDLLTGALLSSRSDAIIASDREGTITFWNSGAERIFGHSASEAIGQSLDLIVPERQRQRHWEGYRHVLATGESRYGHGDLLAVPSLRKDGTRISIEFTIVPLKQADGRMEGLAAILRDVTTRFAEMKALRRRLAEATAPPA